MLRTLLESQSLTNNRHPETRAHRVPEIRFFLEKKTQSQHAVNRKGKRI